MSVFLPGLRLLKVPWLLVGHLKPDMARIDTHNVFVDRWMDGRMDGC